VRARLGNYFLCLCVLLSSGLLTACGFHLRGDIPLPPPLQKLYLKTTDPYGQLSRNIKQYLRFSGVQLVDSPEEAETILVILNETNNEQLLSIGGTQQTRQYNITLTVSFEVTNSRGIVLVPPESLSETRSLTILSNQILGGSNEENNLFVQMRSAIVYDILSRLSSKEVAALVAPAPVTSQPPFNFKNRKRHETSLHTTSPAS
jgi:LPS-assembly lipoprotein